MERLHARISGQVQGVNFRAGVADVARRLSLVGWVRNLADGRVEVVAEGPRSQLEPLADFCRTGPSAAKVDHIDLHFGPALGDLEPGFNVLP